MAWVGARYKERPKGCRLPQISTKEHSCGHTSYHLHISGARRRTPQMTYQRCTTESERRNASTSGPKGKNTRREIVGNFGAGTATWLTAGITAPSTSTLTTLPGRQLHTPHRSLTQYPSCPRRLRSSSRSLKSLFVTVNKYIHPMHPPLPSAHLGVPVYREVYKAVAERYVLLHC